MIMLADSDGSDQSAHRRFRVARPIYEPQREETHLLTCVPNEDSNHPVHPRSQISLRCLASLAVQNALIYTYRKLSDGI